MQSRQIGERIEKSTWQHSSSLDEDYLHIRSAFLHHRRSFDTSLLCYTLSGAQGPQCLYHQLCRTRLPQLKHLLAGYSWRLLSQLHTRHDRGMWYTSIQHVTSFHCHPTCMEVQLPQPPSTLQWHKTWGIKADSTQEAFKGRVKMIIGTLSWISLGLIKHCVILGCLSLWDTDCQHAKYGLKPENLL